MRNAILSLGSIWQDPAEQDSANKPSLAMLLLVFALVALAALTRRPEAIFEPQFWAEDGKVFYWGQVEGASWFSPYRNYICFIPRMTASLASMTSATWAPLIYNLVAWFISVTCYAWIALPAFRHIVRSDAARGALAVLFALIPSAGGIPLNITNIQWPLTLWAVLVSIQVLPRNRLLQILLGFGYFAIAFSAPATTILLPVWALRALTSRKDRLLPLTAIVIQIAWLSAYVLAKEENQAAAAGDAWDSPVMLVIQFIVVRIFLMGTIGSQFVRESLPHTNEALFIAGAIFLAAILAVLRALRKDRTFFAFTAIVALCMLGSAMIVMAGREKVAYMAWHWHGARYFYMPIAMFYIWTFAALSRLWAVPVARYTGWLLAVLVLIAVATNREDPIPPIRDKHWQTWAKGLDAGLQQPDLGIPRVPLNPGGPWFIPGKVDKFWSVQPTDKILALRPNDALVQQVQHVPVGDNHRLMALELLIQKLPDGPNSRSFRIQVHDRAGNELASRQIDNSDAGWIPLVFPKQPQVNSLRITVTNVDSNANLGLSLGNRSQLVPAKLRRKSLPGPVTLRLQFNAVDGQ